MTKPFKEVITKELYQDALMRTWSVELDVLNTFPAPICNWTRKKAVQLGVPYTYIGFPLLSAVAYTLGGSNVTVSESHIEPIIIYSLLVAGRSGTNTSGCLTLISNLVRNLPSEPNKSNLFDTGKRINCIN